MIILEATEVESDFDDDEEAPGEAEGLTTVQAHVVVGPRVGKRKRCEPPTNHISRKAIKLEKICAREPWHERLGFKGPSVNTTLRCSESEHQSTFPGFTQKGFRLSLNTRT